MSQAELKKDEEYMLLDDIRHCIRVGNMAYKLADRLNLSEKEKMNIYIAGSLHDIGKAFLDKNILTKPGRLTENEFKHIKNHIGFGFEEANRLGFNQEIVDYIMFHHESYNGSGYIGLKGEEIPLGATILRICDTYDALLTKRPYKKAFSHEEAIKEIMKTKYFHNPRVFEEFLNLFDEKGVHNYEKVI